MSTANKGEAERCIDIARRRRDAGNLTGALKFARKSLKLHPTAVGEALVIELEKMVETNQSGGDSTAQTQSESSAPQSASNAHNASASTSSASASASSIPSASRTKSNPSRSSSRMTRGEEVEMVKRVLREKDYYKILGVSKDFDAQKLKKSYKKMALKLHPDRNKAPGATEAFKKIAQAYETLKDERKRQIYDQYGPDAPQARGQRAHFEHMTPDDIFAAFFGQQPFGHHSRHGASFHFGGPGFSSFHHSTRRRGNGQQSAEEGSPIMMLLQLMPMVLVLFSMFIPAMLSSGNSNASSGGGMFGSRLEQRLDGNIYAMSREYPFTKRMDSPLEVPYYVQRGFEYRRYRSYGNLQKRVEKEVETKHLQQLETECKEERELLKQAKRQFRDPHTSHLERMRARNDLKDFEKRGKAETDSCSKVEYFLDRM